MWSQPGQLESAEKLPDGTTIRPRSVHPEDERLLVDLAAHMSPEDMRLRFLAAMRGLSHELAARLSDIDPDRDVALLAFAEGAEEALGVARFSGDPDNRAAEFAIAVRTDWKGHGLGHLLMARLTQLARQRGIDELVGEVLPENAAMLRSRSGSAPGADDRQTAAAAKRGRRRSTPYGRGRKCFRRGALSADRASSAAVAECVGILKRLANPPQFRITGTDSDGKAEFAAQLRPGAPLCRGR
jgi:GNAT superfamily N-acetyltransferase